MKSNKILIACLSMSVMMALSCKKNSTTPTTDTTSTQTVEATVAKSATYSYVLPASATSYTISTQASHASSSNISINSGVSVYNYIAPTDFIGVDTIVITPTDSVCMHGGFDGDSTHMPPPPGDTAHGPCNHPHGPHPGGPRIVFHINVKDSTVAP